MNLPLFWRRASFSVAEAADIVGVSEDALRGWLARNVVNDFNGLKVGTRLWLSANDAFYYCLLREFTNYGVPVRTAMHAATPIANSVDDGEPVEDFLIVRTNGGVTNFELTNIANVGERPALTIPLKHLMRRTLARAAEVHATEVS